MEKVSQFNLKMKKFTFLFLIIQSIFVFGQKSINAEALKLFNVTSESKNINKAYADNMFFGIFGIKHFVNALNLNYKGVKSVTITSNANPKIKTPVYKALYNPDGTIHLFEITEQIGKPLQVKYDYKEGIIDKEFIHYQNKDVIENAFYYNDDKMYIQKSNDKFEIIWLDGDVLLKKIYVNNKVETEDRLMHNCRITKSIGQDVNKICFNDTSFKIPLVVTDFVPDVDDNSIKINLKEGGKSEIKLISENKYGIYFKGKERFQITLDKDRRIKSFNYLGNPALKEAPISFAFAYTMY